LNEWLGAGDLANMRSKDLGAPDGVAWLHAPGDYQQLRSAQQSGTISLEYFRKSSLCSAAESRRRKRLGPDTKTMALLLPTNLEEDTPAFFVTDVFDG